MCEPNDLYKELEEARSLPVDTYEDALEKAKKAFDVYFRAKDRKDAVSFDYEAILNGARAIITDIMLFAQADKVTTTVGKAYIPNIGMRVSYDREGLDKLCEENEEIAAILAPFRISKPTSPGLTFVRI